MQVGNLKAALAAAMEWVERRDDPQGKYTLEISVQRIIVSLPTGECFTTMYAPPRVAPVAGTPCLVWRTGESKSSAVVAMSEGEIVVWEGEECLLTQIGMSKRIAYGHWSVLVEKEEQ